MKKNSLLKRWRLLFSGLLILFMMTGCLRIPESITTSAPVETTIDLPTVPSEKTSEDTSPEGNTKETETSLEETTATETTTETESASSAETTEDITDDWPAEQEDSQEDTSGIKVEEDGEYSDKEHVALYIYTYGHLPDNYITKAEAEKLGWVSSKGNLWKVAYGKSIGGSHFGNYEGKLPKKKGRKYYECDIDFDGTYRNAERIIYSNDGLIYYTGDHYETFELLYGEES